MFTGLIERTGRIEALTRGGDGGAQLRIGCAGWTDPLTPGESIAVQGACLTVARHDMAGFTADVLDETLAVTTLGSLRPGALVNLELALAAGGRLGGHIVTGHIDGMGTVETVTPVGRDWKLAIACDAGSRRYIVYKGSIALDGVSLTVSAETDTGFAVNIIPHTWQHTALHTLRAGGRVNLETDILGRYVEKFLACGRNEPAPGSGVSWETLAAAGF